DDTPKKAHLVERPSSALDGGAQGQRGPPAEPPGVGGQVKLKRYNLEDNFHHDMEQYLSTGYLQIAERRAPIGSMSSMEVNVDMLEQMDLMDMSDHEAMDVFLHTGGDDNSAASPVTGPDMEPYTTEISLKVPTQAELRHKLSSLSPTCTDSQDTDGGEEEDDGEVEETSADNPQDLIQSTATEPPGTIINLHACGVGHYRLKLLFCGEMLICACDCSILHSPPYLWTSLR
uniref:Dystrobrevin binding protein 1b n=1 Tax=Gadus morhua TaxID=8049 RepID=A0A8C5F8M6_GADMO